MACPPQLLDVMEELDTAYPDGWTHLQSDHPLISRMQSIMGVKPRTEKDKEKYKNGVVFTWTDEAVTYLKENFQDMPYKELAANLGTTYSVVRIKSSSMGLRKTAKVIPVVQLDKDGRELNRFASITEAGEAVDLPPLLIKDVCRKRRVRAGGFKWAYASDLVEGESENE